MKQLRIAHAPDGRKLLVISIDLSGPENVVHAAPIANCKFDPNSGHVPRITYGAPERLVNPRITTAPRTTATIATLTSTSGAFERETRAWQRELQRVRKPRPTASQRELDVAAQLGIDLATATTDERNTVRELAQ